MKAKISCTLGEVRIDLSKPMDCSLPLSPGENTPRAWYVDPVKFSPVVMGDWIGDVNQGGDVNFKDVEFNPHGNGTHTECVGHISKEGHTINQSLKTFWFTVKLASIQAQDLKNGDQVFTKKQFESNLGTEPVEAFMVRTLPNDSEKRHKNHSNTNWPYVLEEAAVFLRERGIQHYLTDLPSVDREQDEGKLLAHHAFWNYPENPREEATISEMLFIPNSIPDGIYLLNIQIASFELDASPSKPILYRIES